VHQLIRLNLGVKSSGIREDIVKEDYVRTLVQDMEHVNSIITANALLAWMVKPNGLALTVR
jgi:hypothetical protein